MTSTIRSELVFLAPEQAPSGTRFLLGQDDDGVVYFGVSASLPDEQGLQQATDDPRAGHGVHRGALRDVGTVLSDRDAGLLTHAVALANWHDTHTHCPLDGTPSRCQTRPGIPPPARSTAPSTSHAPTRR